MSWSQIIKQKSLPAYSLPWEDETNWFLLLYPVPESECTKYILSIYHWDIKKQNSRLESSVKIKQHVLLHLWSKY